jgi:hypothetical protein
LTTFHPKVKAKKKPPPHKKIKRFQERREKNKKQKQSPKKREESPRKKKKRDKGKEFLNEKKTYFVIPLGIKFPWLNFQVVLRLTGADDDHRGFQSIFCEITLQGEPNPSSFWLLEFSQAAQEILPRQSEKMVFLFFGGF